MTFRDDDVSLADMRDHAEKLIRLVKERDTNDWVTVMAATRLFEILGEAANRVTPETRSTYPDIPWRELVDMRNRITHGYDTVDTNVMWRTAREEIPPLLERLNAIIDERSSDR